ncbi:MAG: hypothetical protein HYU54_03070 [Actinobacteria bacterium]|nr:hypothetical protein [Actinomycetota bacterium]
MKIKGTCRHCGREFLVQQVLEIGGKCPWCGRPFQENYAVVLVDALRDAEAAGNTLENALEKVADMAPDFVLAQDSVLTDIRLHLERVEKSHDHR